MMTFLFTWLNIPDYRESRRFLEAHLELLTCSSETTLEQMIADARANPTDQIVTNNEPTPRAKAMQHIRDHLQVLRNSRLRGGTAEVIREVYVNHYGGFALDLPSWLEEQESQLSLRRVGEAACDRVTLLHQVIEQVRQEPGHAQEILAELHRLLWGALTDLAGPLDAQTQKEQDDCLEAALQVFTFARYPYQYARMQGNLGNVYRRQKNGAGQTRLEEAVACYLRALEVFTLNDFPIEYAKTQHNLSLAYYELREGQRRSHLEDAITCCHNALHVYTLDDFPTQYAHLHSLLSLLSYEQTEGEQRSNLETALTHAAHALPIFTSGAFPIEYAKVRYTLGNIYSERIAGGEAIDLEEAIRCYHCALQVFTSERFPVEYALVQYRLGMTYQNHAAGERQENLEQAIACYHHALQVYTLEIFPVEYAEVYYRLARAYKARLEGERRENLEQALVCYNRALQVYTPDTFPTDYAVVQNNLGALYSERPVGERRTNVEEAIAHYNRALQMYTPDTFPVEYARTQYNLGLVYRERIAGERRANLERAINCYSQALQVYTQEAFPQEYAKLQHNLGIAYQERIEGTRRANLEEALACSSRALQVFTPDAFPVLYAGIQNNLSNVYNERIAGERRANVEQAIAHAKHALEVFTHEDFPTEYATIQFSLSNAYRERIAGERRANLEEAILHCHHALQVYTLEHFPEQYARIQNNLAALYKDRLMGQRRANLEEALACCHRALQVYTRDAFPKDYASVQHNLGTLYSERVEGKRYENLEQAIVCYNRALGVYTRQAFPRDYTLTQNNLGNVYWMRIEGKREQNLEAAIACYQRALEVSTLDDAPVEWARLQNNLGTVYSRRMIGDHEANVEEAIACYQHALRVRTLAAFPHAHRQTQLNLASLEAQRQRWEEAHLAYSGALAAEELLVALGAGMIGRDVILQEGLDAAINDSFVLIRLSRFAEAAVVIERGRARGLAESIALDAAHPDLIQDLARRARYEHARWELSAAQAALHIPPSPDLNPETRRTTDLERTGTYAQAKAMFDSIVDEIRQAEDPADFFDAAVDAGTILRAAESCGQDHAIVYLAATPLGGFALAAINHQPDTQTASHFAAFELPDLTETLVGDLIESRIEYDKESVIVGGLAWAQERQGFKLLPKSPIGPLGSLFRQQAAFLHTACAERGKVSMLDRAAQELLQLPELAEIVDRPLSHVNPQEARKVARILEQTFLHHELQRCLDTLGKLALRPLSTWLQEARVRSVTFIACGMLAAFPLSAVEITPGKTFGDLFVTSVAPNARSLLRYADQQPRAPLRAGVYTFGNPEPNTQPLHWGEAEAYTLAHLARRHHLYAEVKVQHQATRRWLIKALNNGYVVDASCHGQFNSEAPLQSALRVARGEKLTLGRILSREVDLHGLRLLILAACQTAIVDQRGVRDEVYSIAVGMLQAGATAVLAAQWAVDDKATYLLMTRFAQEWFPKMKSEPPAAALARAQQWLRTVTNRELQQWETTNIPSSTREGRQADTQEPERDLVVTSARYPTEAAVRGDRYDIDEAGRQVHDIADDDHPDSCPYDDPIYWAGFQITGW